MHTPLDPARDDIASYEHVKWLKDGEVSITLKRKANGDCVYLADHGCGIYERRPQMCRAFDCREVVRRSNRMGRRRASEQLKQVFNRGRELLSHA